MAKKMTKKRRGPGRPATGKRTVQICFTGSLDDAARIDAVREKLKCSRSEWVRGVVRNALRLLG